MGSEFHTQVLQEECDMQSGDARHRARSYFLGNLEGHRTMSVEVGKGSRYSDSFWQTPTGAKWAADYRWKHRLASAEQSIQWSRTTNESKAFVCSAPTLSID